MLLNYVPLSDYVPSQKRLLLVNMGRTIVNWGKRGGELEVNPYTVDLFHSWINLHGGNLAITTSMPERQAEEDWKKMQEYPFFTNVTYYPVRRTNGLIRDSEETYLFPQECRPDQYYPNLETLLSRLNISPDDAALLGPPDTGVAYKAAERAGILYVTHKKMESTYGRILWPRLQQSIDMSELNVREAAPDD